MILFLTPYPFDTAASQRFRFEQYYSYLKEKNMDFEVQAFWEQKAWEILYQKGKSISKLYYLLKGLLRRFLLVFSCFKYDYIFIHREIYPTGTKFLIYFLSKVLKRKIIYDFDDAIWLPNFADNNKKFAFVKSYGQVKTLCKHAYKVSVGNDYLKDYALHFNKNVIVNPTTIDTDNLHNQINTIIHKPTVIGWTGTHSTLKYVLDLLPILDEFEEKNSFVLMIISDKKPDFKRPYLQFVKWNKSTEIQDLLKFSVGIMPLSDDKWAKGKCGFKALQYMSLGIPALVSPVGVNTKIVDDQVNGWVCKNWNDWRKELEHILIHPNAAIKMGAKAREKIVNSYSVKSNRDNFLGLFN